MPTCHIGRANPFGRLEVGHLPSGHCHASADRIKLRIVRDKLLALQSIYRQLFGRADPFKSIVSDKRYEGDFEGQCFDESVKAHRCH